MRTFAIVPVAGRSQRMGQPKLLLPWGEHTVIEQVLDAWRQGGVDTRIVVPRLPTGRTGHPVLFTWQLAGEIQRLTQGVNELLLRHRVTYVEWQDADAFADLDTLIDYRRLQSRHNQPK